MPTAVATSTDSDSDYKTGFSGTAFSLGFREMFEAAFVTSMLLQSLDRVALRSPDLLTAQKQSKLKKVIAGAILAGVTVCGIGSAAALYAYHQHAKEQVGDKFVDGMEAIMKCLISILVSGFSIEILKMLSANNHQSQRAIEMESSINTAASTDNTWQQFRSIGMMPFMIFAGELAEACLLIGVSGEANNANESGKWAIAGSALAGSFLGFLIVALFHRYGDHLPREVFRKGGAITMALMGAGLACYATHEAQELEWLGPYESESCSVWYNEEMWDMSDCCSDKTNEFFKFLRTTLGYQDKPTPAELIVWLIRMGMTASAASQFLQWEKTQLALEASSQVEELGEPGDSSVRCINGSKDSDDNSSDKFDDIESGEMNKVDTQENTMQI